MGIRGRDVSQVVAGFLTRRDILFEYVRELGSGGGGWGGAGR